MKYVIYLRVSTEKQDERTQLDHCLKYLKAAHQGPFQYLVFQDSITSKKAIDKRKGFSEALNAIRAGDVLVGMRIDRIARNLHETTCLIDKLDKKKAEVLMVEQPGIKNKIMLGLYAGMAEEETKLLRKRVKEKLDSKKERGELTNYKTVYGKSLDKENLIPIKNKDGKDFTLKPGILLDNALEQQALELMCNLFDQGYSYHSICKELANQGYMNRAGKQFQKTSVLRILHRTGRCRPKAQEMLDQEYDLLHA